MWDLIGLKINVMKGSDYIEWEKAVHVGNKMLGSFFYEGFFLGKTEEVNRQKTIFIC